MVRVVVVGSGASGVHFALTMLERGHHVTMLDVGHPAPEPVAPDADFQQLKDVLDDPESYFLGPQGESVVFPSPTAKPYGFPVSKAYVFERPSAFTLREAGFNPLVSFARGGLAEAWTGGSYELRDEELQALGLEVSSMRRAYDIVARRIGIGAAVDDLARFSPVTASYQEPLEMDPHSAALVARYATRRERLNRLGVYLGRSRVAVLSRDLGDRKACSHLGRCLWGCPRGSLYAPSLTLPQLLRHPNFEYRPGHFVRRVLLGAGERVTGVVAERADAPGATEVHGDAVVLAAGTLATARIYLETLEARGETEAHLPGLMDNGHVMVPFVNVSRLGTDVALAAYQFHMLAMAIDRGDWRRDAHAQVTTLKAAAVHPIVNNLPFDLRTSLRFFQRIRGALGVANLWVADERRDHNVVRLERLPDGGRRLVLEYTPSSHDADATRDAVATLRQGLGALGCVAPSWMPMTLPRGSSVHYAGTLPVSTTPRVHAVDDRGAVYGFDGLHVVDGSSLSWLPAKNLTFTLMANAVRVAERLADS